MYDTSQITPDRLILASLDKKDQFCTLAKQEKWGAFIVGEKQVISAAKSKGDIDLEGIIRGTLVAHPALFDVISMRTAAGENEYGIEPMSLDKFILRLEQDTMGLDLTGRKKTALHPFADLNVALRRVLDSLQVAPCVQTGS